MYIVYNTMYVCDVETNGIKCQDTPLGVILRCCTRSKLPPAALIRLSHQWVGGGEQGDALDYHYGGDGIEIVCDF